MEKVMEFEELKRVRTLKIQLKSYGLVSYIN